MQGSYAVIRDEPATRHCLFIYDSLNKVGSATARTGQLRRSRPSVAISRNNKSQYSKT